MRVLKPVSIAVAFMLLLSTPAFITGTGTRPGHNPQPFTTVDLSMPNTMAAKADMLYDSMQLSLTGLNKAAFEYALKGYDYLKRKKLIQSSLISICDFSQSSRQKRFYIIDLAEMKLLVNTYVAHGRNSGGEYAKSFSNSPESHKSSLGFYKTLQPYNGEHGLSLRIGGLERGINDRADRRNIVIHGSEYVGDNFIQNNPFAGRSYGCPALPSNEIEEVVNTIKDGTCLFIYHPTKNYIKKSKILNA